LKHFDGGSTAANSFNNAARAAAVRTRLSVSQLSAALTFPTNIFASAWRAYICVIARVGRSLSARILVRLVHGLRLH
jgi:hypothetical protein